MDLLEIGRIDKSHGLRGELVVTITSDRPERLAPGAVWFVDGIEMTVEAIRPHQHRWIVRLEGVNGREAADVLHGAVVSAEPIDDPDALWVHDLVGAELFTVDGRSWGEVTAVVANPADDLLELADGSLVPIGFVVDDSELPERIVVDVPEGLLGADDD